GQLLTAPDGARGPDPNRAADDVNVAVRMAGVIDEARDVAADARVDHGAVRQLETPDVAVPDVAALAFQALLVGDLLARVVRDPLVFGDRLGRVDAPAVNLRPTPFDHHP